MARCKHGSKLRADAGDMGLPVQTVCGGAERHDIRQCWSRRPFRFGRMFPVKDQLLKRRENTKAAVHTHALLYGLLTCHDACCVSIAAGLIVRSIAEKDLALVSSATPQHELCSTVLLSLHKPGPDRPPSFDSPIADSPASQDEEEEPVGAAAAASPPPPTSSMKTDKTQPGARPARLTFGETVSAVRAEHWHRHCAKPCARPCSDLDAGVPYLFAAEGHGW